MNGAGLKNPIKIVAAVLLFATALMGIHFNVEYSGWGIFLATLLIIDSL